MDAPLAIPPLAIADDYVRIRKQSENLCAPLEPEDYLLQSMADVSPAKWHLAHTTWFFETFVLKPYCDDYTVFNPHFNYLFNSYYNGIGRQYPREQRGQLSRPSVEEVFQYRQYVDNYLLEWLDFEPPTDQVTQVITLGLNHEQQHQELILTDLKYCLFQNPMMPAFLDAPLTPSVTVRENWSPFDKTTFVAGHASDTFCYDNETPAHEQLVLPFQIMNRLTTNQQYLEFIADGGYARPELWLSDGWSHKQAQDWSAPLYWKMIDGTWFEFTLSGLSPLDLNAPVTHISYYEAMAFAQWREKRLPTEFEWELAAQNQDQSGNFVDSGSLHPAPAKSEGLEQLFGDCWEWTQSAYLPYPGFKAPEGAVGEYNGKFMCNQMVLKGGSCATPADHIRASYRNFFYPKDRWQFKGIRLAESL